MTHDTVANLGILDRHVRASKTKHQSKVWQYGPKHWAFSCTCGIALADLPTQDVAEQHRRDHTNPTYIRPEAPVEDETLYTSKGEEIAVRMSDREVAETLVLRSAEHIRDGRPNGFVTDLANGFAKYGSWTANQRPWAHKLAYEYLDRQNAPAAPAPEDSGDRGIREVIQDAGGLTALVEMLHHAANHRKFPRVVLGLDAGTIRINIAGARARVPGSLNVTSNGAFDDRAWYGRIHVDGRFEAGRNCPDWVVDALREFNADPAGMAKVQGQRFSNCCFCSRELTTNESLAVGYGPICAEYYGLPWGA